MKKRFHCGSLKSPRLKKLLKVLRMARKTGATTLELAKACNSTRPSSDISEARANGVKIQKTYEGETESGRRIYRYKLL